MSLKMKVEASKKIDEGLHRGAIVGLKTREGVSKKNQRPYKYVDLTILEASGVELKAGYSAYITKESQLGQLLMRFGAVVVKDAEVDLEAVLLNKQCAFLTQDRKDGDATYSDVIASSVKPAV